MTTRSPLNRRHVACAVRPGGPEVLDVKTEDVAPPGPEDALVRVEAVGLNHVETLVRSGTYSIRVPFPHHVGIEGAGTVLAAGSDVAIAPGTRVCWTGIFGSCATVVTAPARMLAALPDGLDFEAGASLAHAGVTAAGLASHCPLAKRARAVVWGAAGAVGRLLVAFLADRDVSVIGIASGTRVEAVRRAGAEFVVDRAAEDVVEAVRGHTRGEGVAAVFDPVGTATYQTSLRLLAPRGCLVNYGQLSGSLPAVDLTALMEAGSVFVTKYGPRAGLIDRNHIAGCISHALALALTRPLTCDVAARFPLSSVSEAYRVLESHPAGKVLVLPQVRLTSRTECTQA
jgi:NADPH2:quinone reductase